MYPAPSPSEKISITTCWQVGARDWPFAKWTVRPSRPPWFGCHSVTSTANLEGSDEKVRPRSSLLSVAAGVSLAVGCGPPMKTYLFSGTGFMTTAPQQVAPGSYLVMLGGCITDHDGGLGRLRPNQTVGDGID